MTKNNRINKEQFTTWLNTAIPFSVWRWSNKQHVIKARDFISAEIGEQYRNSRDKGKDNDMLLNFLLNLWVGFCIGCPIHISLNSNRYSKNQPLDKVFFSYERTRRIIEALERKGYLQRAGGYFLADDKKQTRIWGTEKLIKLFVYDYGFLPIGDQYEQKQTELIQLRNIVKKKTKKKKSVRYAIPVEFEHTEETLAMKEHLEQYNTLAQDNKITLNLRAEDNIKVSTLIDEILQGFVSGAITLVDGELDFRETVSYQRFGTGTHISDHSDTVETPVLSVFKDIPGLEIISISYVKHKIPTLYYDNDDTVEPITIDTILPSITNSLQSQQWCTFPAETRFFLYLFYLKKMFSLIKMKGRTKHIRARKRKELLNEERPLADFGINRLEFKINKTDLHRVFNCSPKDIENGTHLNFDKGGRFYGSFYQGVSEDCRSRILINGNETVEIDYSSLHPRMLYHKLGIDYQEDPYLIGDNSLRAQYKIVALISINAKKQGSHMAVRDALVEAGFDEYREDLEAVKALMKDYQNTHTPIQEFLFSGVGVKLQNADSIIMENILMRLLNKKDKKVCGLCIHDSVIVEKDHQEFLYQAMIEEYEKEMGYTPVLK